MAVTTEPKHFGLLIDGEWLERHDGKLLEVRSPNDGQVFATLPEATQADIDAAIEAAQRAYDKQELSAYQRYEILLKGLTASLGARRGHRLSHEHGRR